VIELSRLNGFEIVDAKAREDIEALKNAEVNLDGYATENYVKNAIAEADLLIAGGSSLTVYPAASLVGNFEGGKLVIINYSQTAYDDSADLVIRASIGEVLSAAILKE
jgi:NAD-dependent SIR2 family protein deacetylase